MSETEEPTVATTENPSEGVADKFDRSDVIDEPAAEEPKKKSTRGKKAAELDEHPDGVWSITAGGPTSDRTATVHKPYHYKDLARDIDWSGDFRELAALNGIRNGRYAIDPGTTIAVPATRLPVREPSGNRVAALAELAVTGEDAAEEPEGA